MRKKSTQSLMKQWRLVTARDTLLDLANYAIMTVLEMDAPDESHATMYAYDKPFYTVGEDK